MNFLTKSFTYALFPLVLTLSAPSFAASQRIARITTSVPFTGKIDFRAQLDSQGLGLSSISVVWMDGTESFITIPQLKHGYVFQTDPEDETSKWFGLKADASFNPATGGRLTLVFGRQTSVGDFRAFSFWISRPAQSGPFQATTDADQGGYLPFDSGELSITLLRKRVDTVTLKLNGNTVVVIDASRLPRNVSYRRRR